MFLELLAQAKFRTHQNDADLIFPNSLDRAQHFDVRSTISTHGIYGYLDHVGSRALSYAA